MRIELTFEAPSALNLSSQHKEESSERLIYGRRSFCEYKSKSKKGSFQEELIYFKCTETKLLLLFTVISLYFNAPVPAFHKFFFLNFSAKSFFLVASLTSFVPRQ
jgi:hypothetical protein